MPMDPNMPPAGAPSPSDVAALHAEEQRARMGAMAATAPVPKRPLSIKPLVKLRDQINDTVKAILGDGYSPEQHEVRWEPPADAKGGRLTSPDGTPIPIPQELFLPVIALEEAVERIAGENFAKKYDLAPGDLAEDGGVKAATGELARMEKDKKLHEALRGEGAPSGPPPEAPPMPPEAPPAPMPESERALMGAM